MTAFAGITEAQLAVTAGLPCLLAAVSLVLLLALALVVGKHPHSRDRRKGSEERPDKLE